jgi:hypothetical protein
VKSTTLSKYISQKWTSTPLKNILEKLPQRYGVYVICTHKYFGRFKRVSDIVYIGSARGKQGLKGRFRAYYSPQKYQQTNKRVGKLFGSRYHLNIFFVVKRKPNTARELERKLLKKYESQHGELPPLNHNA